MRRTTVTEERWVAVIGEDGKPCEEFDVDVCGTNVGLFTMLVKICRACGCVVAAELADTHRRRCDTTIRWGTCIRRGISLKMDCVR